MDTDADDRMYLIVEGADLMCRAAAMSRDLAELPRDAVAAYGQCAAHLATTGMLLGQCLSWGADDLSADFTAPFNELTKHLRALARRVSNAGSATPSGDMLALRREVEAYHARVLHLAFRGTTVLPFRRSRG